MIELMFACFVVGLGVGYLVPRILDWFLGPRPGSEG